MKRKPRHLSTRIAESFLMIILPALLIISMLTGSLFRIRVTEEADQLARQQLTLGTTELGHQLASMRSLYFTVVHDGVLQEGMSYLQEQNGTITLNDFLPISRRISTLTDDYSNVRFILLIDPQDRIVSPIYSAEPYRSWLLTDVSLERFRQSGLSVRFSEPNRFPLLDATPDFDQKNTIFLYGTFFSENYRDKGTVVIGATKASLLSTWENMAKEAFSTTYILDEKGSIISQTNPLEQMEGQTLLDLDEGTQTLNGNTYLCYSTAIPEYPAWKVCVLQSQNQLFKPMQIFYRQMMLVILLMGMILTLSTVSLSRHITRPLKNISEAMSKVGVGHWQLVPEDSATIDTQEITSSYNQMVDSLETLTQTIKEEQTKREAIKLQMVQSKLEQLQSQINPHFIHNTLNTMRYMAQKENNTELSELIVSFNSLLRASMSQTDSVHPLRQEVALLEHYLNIQLKRFDVQLAFLTDFSPASLEVPVPKMLLQPLIENALYHGILPKGCGTISLRGRVAQHRLWITIFDDGQGIPASKLDKLLTGELPNNRGYNQIGLINVNSRLELFYGAASQLLIESKEGKGTSIYFSIPVGEDQGLTDDLVEPK